MCIFKFKQPIKTEALFNEMTCIKNCTLPVKLQVSVGGVASLILVLT